MFTKLVFPLFCRVAVLGFFFSLQLDANDAPAFRTLCQDNPGTGICPHSRWPGNFPTIPVTIHWGSLPNGIIAWGTTRLNFQNAIRASVTDWETQTLARIRIALSEQTTGLPGQASAALQCA